MRLDAKSMNYNDRTKPETTDFKHFDGFKS